MTASTRAGRVLLALLIAAAAIPAGVCGSRATADPPVEPESRERIEQVVAAIVRQDADVEGRMQALTRIGQGGREALLLQLALYLRDSRSTESSMAAALIVQRLEFTSEEKLAGILPHLETAGPELRRVLSDLLGTIDRARGGDPDFRFYEEWMRRRNASPPALVRYLYEVSPDAAVRSLTRVNGARVPGADAAAARLEEVGGILARRDASASLSEQDLGRARAALDEISRNPAWWVRLYAATVLARHREIGAPETTQRLERDPDPVVREALDH